VRIFEILFLIIILREITVANKRVFSPSLLSYNFYKLIQFKIQVNILKRIPNTKINLTYELNSIYSFQNNLL